MTATRVSLARLALEKSVEVREEAGFNDRTPVCVYEICRKLGVEVRFGLTFRSLWGRKLQLIDCQNLFCEVDKYARVHHPKIAGLSGRTRIKQKYTQHPAPLTYWYPPKWGLNDLIPRPTARRAEGA